MMLIERIEETRLTAQDEAQIAGLMARAFDTDFGGRSYYQQRHHVRLVTRENGKITGHMALDFRDIRIGETLMPVAGLAEVATHPDLRGKGIAGHLLSAAIHEARAMRAQFFVLFGDRPIYAGRGFLAQPNSVTFTALIGARTGAVQTVAASNLMVMQLGDSAWDSSLPVDLLGHKF